MPPTQHAAALNSSGQSDLKALRLLERLACVSGWISVMSFAMFVVNDCEERVAVIRETRDNPEQ